VRIRATDLSSVGVDGAESMAGLRAKDGITIRPLKEDDLEQVPRVWVEAGLPYRPNGRDSPEGLRAQLSRDPDLFLGAFEGALLIGVAIATDDGRKGWINRLAVLPSHRRMGVARALVDGCEDALRKRGRGVFSILIEGRNDASERLFLTSGYRDESEIRYYAKRDSEET
jgi:ribosomal protein S18 acetylase RimI-like enzyme